MYSYFTGQRVPLRQPYAGKLVFAAFSGSHQDAIAKGMRWRESHDGVWDVPYLPIDPKDIGREYEGEIIRINSQSGKGGVGYVLENMYDLRLPALLKDKFVKIVKHISEMERKELKPAEVYELFLNTYLRNEKYFSLSEVDYRLNNGIDAEVLLTDNQSGKTVKLLGHGNGRLNAVSNILKNYLTVAFKMKDYDQQALVEKAGTSSKAITYISVEAGGKIGWGVGVHDDSNSSSVRALCAALNNLLDAQ
jgi:2-isopropylmalate synthase